MPATISRRQFATVAAAASTTLLLNEFSPVFGKPSAPSVPKSALGPVSINYVPGVYQDRRADLGGTLDATTGVIWGYEPYASLSNSGIGFAWASTIHQHYLDLLSSLASTPPADGQPDNRAIYQEAYNVASQRFWRVPTVFEARDAVSKGLFTVGSGGCNMYYGSPTYTQPGVSYGLGNLRWSSSETPRGQVHAWSAADGGTMLVSKTSSILAIVVSSL